MGEGDVQRRRAFVHYLRTGRRLRVASPDEVELKFNPYHDPRNGQFTFAPGGPRSLDHVIVSDRLGNVSSLRSAGPTSSVGQTESRSDHSGPVVRNAVYQVGAAPPQLQPAQYRPPPRGGMGGNIRPFQVPMTLQQVFPGLNSAPGNAIIALADNVFDFTAPGRELTASLTLDISNALIDQIRAINPNYGLDSLGFPVTTQGQVNQIDGLRFQLAATSFRVRGDAELLKVEVLRHLQRQTDEAYVEGLQLLKQGRLNIRLSPQEAVGNFVDRRVRRELRERFNLYGISMIKGGVIGVNSREYNTSGMDRTYRRPDARIGDVAFDVTLTRKTLSTPQVRGFFTADFAPKQVVIVRPSQLGEGSSYVITRPEIRR